MKIQVGEMGIECVCPKWWGMGRGDAYKVEGHFHLLFNLYLRPKWTKTNCKLSVPEGISLPAARIG